MRSRICTQSQLGEPWFRAWCEALGTPPRSHRKLWEYAYLAHVLDTLDLLRPGNRGLGFGVGREALVALFAGRGCRVVATDLPAGSGEARACRNTHQHGGGLDGLADHALCEPQLFRELVRWRAVDMRAPRPPDRLRLLLVGLLARAPWPTEAGMNFVERSTATLAPGRYCRAHDGVHPHLRRPATVDTGPTVLHRRRDVSALIARLEAAGHHVAALDLDPGDGVLDRYVDVPPYSEEPHLRVWYRKFTTTSLALMIRAKG